MGLSVALILVLALTAVPVWPLDFNITTTWNGGEIDHEPVQLNFIGSDDGQFLEMEILAPFFNDPKEPPGPPGQPFYGLWEYEVVEAFFLNDEDQYLEVEVGPYGHHIVLLLNGQRVTIRHSLPMEVTAERLNDTWSGIASIPVEYLPKNVTKFNAYAIHGSGENRIYESLYPAPADAANPDFHALEYFEEIDLSSVLPDQAEAEMSQFWTDSLEGIFRYQIKTKWNSVPVDHEPVEITLQGYTAGVEMNVTAPFFNDPAPEGKPGEPFYKLWDYEVVEMFFLNNNEEYLEVELGPWGEHLLLLLKGARNTLKHSIPLDYIILEKKDPIGNQPGQWKGSAMLPPGYFPPNVTRMNAYAIHGTDEAREYQSLYPAPNNDPAYPVADFHRLELFRPIDFQFLMPNNSYYSELWQDAIESSSSALTVVFKDEEVEDPVTVLGLSDVFVTTFAPTEIVTTFAPPEPVTVIRTPDEISLVHEETASLRKPKPQQIFSDEPREQRLEEESDFFPFQSIGPSEVPRPHLVSEGDRGIIDNFGTNPQRFPILQESEVKEPAFTFHAEAQPFPQPQNPNRFQRPSLFEGGIPAQSSSVLSGQPRFPVQAQPPPPRFPQKQIQGFRVTQAQRPPAFPSLELPIDQNQEQSTFVQQGQFSTPSRRRPERPAFLNQGQSRFQVPGQPDFSIQRPNPFENKFQNKGQPQFEERPQSQFQDSSIVDFQNQAPPRFQDQGQPPIQAQEQAQFKEPVPASIMPQFPAQEPNFQSSVPGSVASVVSPIISTGVQDNVSPEVEQALITLAEGTPALPPPHPICFEIGLVPDPNRCYAFHECVLEEGEWHMYSWRCKRGQIFDPMNVACIRGRCLREETLRRRLSRPRA